MNGVKPLTRDEREALMRWATNPENAAMWKVEATEAMRWEMTVRVAEARLELVRDALRRCRGVQRSGVERGAA